MKKYLKNNLKILKIIDPFRALCNTQAEIDGCIRTNERYFIRWV